jgi:hypothetical protein
MVYSYIRTGHIAKASNTGGNFLASWVTVSSSSETHGVSYVLFHILIVCNFTYRSLLAKCAFHISLVGLSNR